MIRLTRRFRKQAEPADYICPRCGQLVDRLTPDHELTVNEHRLFHLAKQWGESLEGSTGWIVDDDGGLRPVTE